MGAAFMKRCHFCGGRIWPWQNAGWIWLTEGTVMRWHGRCFPEYEE